MRARPAPKLLGELAIIALVAGFSSGCGGVSRSAAIEQYECSQINVATVLADATADETGAWHGVSLARDVAHLDVPALRPVPIASASGTSLPWGEMTPAQQDTWSAWSGVDGRALISQESLPTDPVGTCTRPPVPPRPKDGFSTKFVEGAAGSIYSSNVAIAIDRIVRGNHDAALVAAVERTLTRTAGDLQDTFLAGLEVDALTAPPWLAYDSDADGYLGASAQYRNPGLRLSAPQLVLLLDGFASQDHTWRAFLTTLAKLQAQQILAHTKVAPPRSSRTPNADWAAEIAATDAVLFVVYGLPGERRLRPTIASYRDAVVRAVDGNGSVAAELDREHPTQPFSTLEFRSAYSLAIVAGYVRNGVVTPPADTVRGGLIPPPADLSGDGLASLDAFLVDDQKALNVFGGAEEAADEAYDDRIVGCCAGGKRIP